MKFSALIAIVVFTSVNAHHLCDDENTEGSLQLTSPLAIIVENALSDKQAAEIEVANLKTKLSDLEKSVTTAQNNKAKAKAAYDMSSKEVDLLSAQFAAITVKVKNCKTTDANSNCTIQDKNVFANQMKDISAKMQENDQINQTNKVQYEQMVTEFNQANTSFANQSNKQDTESTRATADLLDAAGKYQDLKDKLDKHVSSGQENQKNCKLNQFHNDMAELQRLENILSKCKDRGCTQDEYNNGWVEEEPTSDPNDPGSLTPEDIEQMANQAKEVAIEKKFTKGGKIRLPNCGEQIEEKCFFAHYTRYWLFDTLNVFAFPVALIACDAMPYNYNFCIQNFIYAVADSSTRTIAPYEEESYESEEKQ